VHMPLAVTVDPAPLSRADLGLPDRRFLFLMMYDALSITERKNPRGAIEAFRRAFPGGTNAGLIVRVNHAASRPDELATVGRLGDETAGVQLIDRPLSREQAQALQLQCDALVSLHRSEGFGFNIAEAMLMGKPVIATGYSGNLDFSTPRNSCLVDYELVPLTEDFGPYQKGNRWADPDIDQAANYMTRLVDDEEFRRQVAIRGQQTIAEELSTKTIAARYQRRLSIIRRRN